MTSLKIKRTLVWIGGVVIAATAYGAIQLFAPKPPIVQAANNAKVSVLSPTLAESETAAATRVCAKMGKIVEGLGMTPPIQLSDCIEADRSCVKLWGPHSVWAGAADQNNVPYCDCDVGFTWIYGSTSGTGKCVRQ